MDFRLLVIGLIKLKTGIYRYVLDYDETGSDGKIKHLSQQYPWLVSELESSGRIKVSSGLETLDMPRASFDTAHVCLTLYHFTKQQNFRPFRIKRLRRRQNKFESKTKLYFGKSRKHYG